MNAEHNPKLYEDCERVFLTEIAHTIDIVVSRISGLSEEEKKKLVEDLSFAVAGHLSSSSFNGRVAGKEIYPKFGFYHGEYSQAVVFGESSRLYSMVPEVMEMIRSREK